MGKMPIGSQLNILLCTKYGFCKNISEFTYFMWTILSISRMMFWQTLCKTFYRQNQSSIMIYNFVSTRYQLYWAIWLNFPPSGQTASCQDGWTSGQPPRCWSWGEGEGCSPSLSRLHYLHCFHSRNHFLHRKDFHKYYFHNLDFFLLIS